MSEANAITTDDTRPAYRWQAHPAREQVGRTIVAAAIIAAVAVGVLTTVLLDGGGLAVAGAWSGGSIAVLVLSMHRFFFSSRFSIDDEGITAVSLLGRRRFRWSDLRRFSCDANGGFLSTRVRPSRLDAFKGMHVLFGTDRHEAEAAIRDHLGRGGE